MAISANERERLITEAETLRNRARQLDERLSDLAVSEPGAVKARRCLEDVDVQLANAARHVSEIQIAEE